MENQHKKIKGYRALSPEEIGMMNEFKRMEAELMTYIEKLQARGDIRQRDLAIAKTNFQTAFMWAVRSVAKPDEIPEYTMEESGK